MPAKNRIKPYVENSYYHIYNRGVEKRSIFMDNQDYAVFLSYLKTYLLPKDIKTLQSTLADPQANSKEKNQALKLIRMNNFADSLSLLAYCLMSNHFHLLVKQTAADTIDRFMNSLCTRYTMYFNRKYQRIGPLFQGIYKAVIVLTDEQLLHLTRYIHLNPALNPTSQGLALRNYSYSSYSEFLGLRHTDWLKPQEILSMFKSSLSLFPKDILSYQSFVEDYNRDDNEILGELTLE